ncbi:unnamed protein product [Rotaria magnacalcarata]|uniref:Uncharacterized protein n=1 Tax=Rotaria magnacalcarata TaxID=392030 RepID=A0A8S3HQK1_9BILA|nr:unnamed protein product [Rotaria magnacalcarata]
MSVREEARLSMAPPRNKIFCENETNFIFISLTNFQNNTYFIFQSNNSNFPNDSNFPNNSNFTNYSNFPNNSNFPNDSNFPNNSNSPNNTNFQNNSNFQSNANFFFRLINK